MRVRHLMTAAAAATIGVSACTGLTRAGPAMLGGSPSGVVLLQQGADWTPTSRAAFYRTGQGSEIMPIAWARALTTDDGSPFLGDRLARYGYLAGDATAELPVGFTDDTRAGTTYLGMTCAACHTREIHVGGAAYRVDGGPALSDFQRFLSDLDGAVGRVLADDAAFGPFADRAIGAAASPAARDTLKRAVAAWYRRQHTLFARALPPEPWGVGRLDAVSMILNRVAGLDIGTTDDGIIASNIAVADAPVRYPFIWDAPRQDHTQWPGFASNGDSLLAIARNLGEVYGVFADFHPVRSSGVIGWSFRTHNSANFNGLGELEGLVRRIGAPAWPWPVDADRASRGAAVFARECASCHAEQRGAQRLVPLSATWRTPIVDAGTDTREYQVLARRGSTGVLQGARYDLTHRLGSEDDQFHILAAAVVGSITDCFLHLCLDPKHLVGPLSLARPKRSTVEQELARAYQIAQVAQIRAAGTHPYEARVLHGIWATAPYLHNGSVASLAELLKAPEDRLPSFAVGPAYDLAAVGLAAVQPGSSAVRITTGCDRLDSSNSRCGHRYGTAIAEADKRDLLEFLKRY